MRFSWKALVLAPLLVPFLFSALLTASMAGKSPFLGFLIFGALGSVISYGATIALLLPSLYALSKVTKPTLIKTCIVGAILGMAIFVPYTWVSWHASGIDSGPPTSAFLSYLWRDTRDPISWAMFPGGGLMTALAYWLLSDKKPN